MKRIAVAIGLAVCAMMASTALADTTYRVQQGDTNWGIIAFRNETTVRDLLRANMGRTRARDCREGERGMWSVSARCRVHFVKVGDVLTIPDSRAELMERNAALLAERDRVRAEASQKQAQIDAMDARLRGAATEIANLRTQVSRLTTLNAQLQTARTATEGGMGLGWTIFAVVPLLLIILYLATVNRRMAGSAADFQFMARAANDDKDRALQEVDRREKQLNAREIAVKELEKKYADLARRESAVNGLEEENSTRKLDLKSGLEHLQRDRQKLADDQVALANGKAELERDREKLRPDIVAEVTPQINAQVLANYEAREQKLQDDLAYLQDRRREVETEREELKKLRDELEGKRKRSNTEPMPPVVVADAPPSDEVIIAESGVHPVQDPSSEVTRKIVAFAPYVPHTTSNGNGMLICSCGHSTDEAAMSAHLEALHFQCMACGMIVMKHEKRGHIQAEHPDDAKSRRRSHSPGN